MKKLFLFFLLLVSGFCFAQDSTKVDSIPVLTLKEFKLSLERLNNIIKKQFDLSDESYSKYQKILREMNMILAEVEKKRKK
jgi:hypothetical protein